MLDIVREIMDVDELWILQTSISGTIFIVYLEKALRYIRNQYIVDQNEHFELPNELAYADDCDFVTEYGKKRHNPPSRANHPDTI